MTQRGETVIDGNVVLHLDRCAVSIGKKDISLTATECALLACLIEEPGVVLCREELIDRIWGEGFHAKPASLNTHILRLRQKLGKAAKAIQTVRGQGYRWKAV